MRSPILSAIFLLSVLYFNPLLAQDELKDAEARETKKDTKTFSISSLDGKNEIVTIIPDYVHKVLKIACSKDALIINNFWGVPPVLHSLGKNFIQIDYAVRGGTNLALNNTLIVCVNADKIHNVFHVLQSSNWDDGDTKTNYHINLKLSGTNKTNYKLTANIQDNVYDKPMPERNYSFNDQATLNFDTRQNAFYSIKSNVYDHFVYTDTRRKTKQKLDGFVPVVMLGKETYYLIGKSWYQSGDNKEMILFE